MLYFKAEERQQSTHLNFYCTNPSILKRQPRGKRNGKQRWIACHEGYSVSGTKQKLEFTAFEKTVKSQDLCYAYLKNRSAKKKAVHFTGGLVGVLNWSFC